MSDLEKATQTEVNNIHAKTGKTLEELSAIIQGSGLSKHCEISALLQKELGLGFGDANTLVHFLRQSDGTSAATAKGATTDDVLEEIYSGAKDALRPTHTALMTEIDRFGPFEIVPKKGYVSLRRKKQFATIGPATNTRVEVGLNMKGLPGTGRLLEQAPGGMCQYKVRVTDAGEVDGELLRPVSRRYTPALRIVNLPFRSRNAMHRQLLAILLLPFLVIVVLPFWMLSTFPALDTRWGEGSIGAWLARPGGALLFAAGLALSGWCVVLFARIGRGTLAPWDPTRELVAAGPYRFVRNPMIEGVVLMLVGEALFWGSALLGTWAGFFLLVNHIYFVVSEEPGLEKRFGEDYRVYKGHVPRWIPRRKPWAGK